MEATSWLTGLWGKQGHTAKGGEPSLVDGLGSTDINFFGDVEASDEAVSNNGHLFRSAPGH